MRFQKLAPSRSLQSLGSRVEAVLPQDGGDGPTPDLVAQIGEGALNPRLAPIAILRRHPHDQLPNLRRHGWATRPAPGAAVILAGDQLPMPHE